MKILDPGHKYQVICLDGDEEQTISFVKREGEEYPGNLGSYPGTNCQDVIRVLIDRIEYLDNQIPWSGNQIIVEHLRQALWLFEVRAAQRRGQSFDVPSTQIDKEETCGKCGHVNCRKQHNGKT